MPTAQPSDNPKPIPGPLTLARCALGGVLMGLANLVPGISGGTMLLAAGVYRLFIESIAQLSTLKLRPTPIIVLATVATSALIAIVLLSTAMKNLVVNDQWIAYSLFIGLTLGGVPLVANLLRRADAPYYRGALFGFAIGLTLMALMALTSAQGATTNHSTPMLFASGIAGASAMILPGVSGAYLLLILGQYVTILSAISSVKDAIRARDISAITAQLDVVIPVALGVVVGIVVVSNLMRLLLKRYERATLGALLGLLIGSVLGLYPFKERVEPTPGTVIKGIEVTAQNIADIEREDWPSIVFAPPPMQVLASLALIATGFALTLAIARLGRSKPSA